MRITCIWSRDKNPMIEIEEKQPKHQNPQKSYVLKSHEKCELIEKEGLKETYQDKKTKTLERLRQKTKNKSIYIYIYWIK